VVFTDANGERHELKMVRSLRVADLASDSAACKGPK
jgi:hypothetical protein